MKKFTGKQLAIVVWVIAILRLIINYKSLINTISDGLNFDSLLWGISIIFGIVVQIIIGYAMFIEKNNIFTVITVLLFCLSDIFIPIARNLPYWNQMGVSIIIKSFIHLIPACILIVGLFLRRKSEKAASIISKYWFVPAVLELLCILLSGSISISSIVIGTVNYLVLGYWILYWLKAYTDKAYYDNLLNNGIISQEEHDLKIGEITNK